MKKQFRLYHPGVSWYPAVVTDRPDSTADLKTPELAGSVPEQAVSAATRNLDLSIATLESQL